MASVRPTDGMVVTESVKLEPGTYVLPSGIQIGASGVRVDADGVVLIGANREGVGVSVSGQNDVTVSGIALREYYQGIHASACKGLKITGCNITSTAEVSANTVFLDIWKLAADSYGGAICLVECHESAVEHNDLQHQMNGILTYDCTKLNVGNNICAYNSGFGIHLSGTCDSLFAGNCCDYCCRFEPREGGLHFGHMGADAAGFLAVRGSCRNSFVRNTARMSGDGFFLAGLAPDMVPCGCDDNLFEENDGSLSPNIAFESTFCKGNTFRNNFADRCGYGFWCGYSKDVVIEGNRMVCNRQAGIAVENGVGFKATNNQFQSNGHGILLWSKHSKEFEAAYPDRDTSRDWEIAGNTMHRNGIGIRIAAAQDHGIRNLENDAAPRPTNHTIVGNDIQDNRIGIQLVGADANTIRENTLNANVEANLRLDDSNDNTIVNNLGARGAYL